MEFFNSAVEVRVDAPCGTLELYFSTLEQSKGKMEKHNAFPLF
jgi:hypothetical protein